MIDQLEDVVEKKEGNSKHIKREKADVKDSERKVKRKQDFSTKEDI